MEEARIQKSAPEDLKPSLPLRILRFPLTLMLLGSIGLILSMQFIALFFMMLGIDPESPLKVLEGMAYAAAVIAFYRLFVLIVEGEEKNDFAWDGAAGETALGLLGGALIFSLALAIVWAMGGYEITGLRRWDTLWNWIYIALFSGFFEEALFRGFIFRHLEKLTGSIAALLVSALLFGLMHLGNPNAGWIPALAIAIEAGIMLGAVYMLTRRLWAAAGLHAAWNFTQGYIFGIPVSGTTDPGLVTSRRNGPEWLTGGEFGLEASMVAMAVATLAGFALLYMAARRGEIRQPFWWPENR